MGLARPEVSVTRWRPEARRLVAWRGRLWWCGGGSRGRLRGLDRRGRVGVAGGAGPPSRVAVGPRVFSWRLDSAPRSLRFSLCVSPPPPPLAGPPSRRGCPSPRRRRSSPGGPSRTRCRPLPGSYRVWRWARWMGGCPGGCSFRCCGLRLGAPAAFATAVRRWGRVPSARTLLGDLFPRGPGRLVPGHAGPPLRLEGAGGETPCAALGSVGRCTPAAAVSPGSGFLGGVGGLPSRVRRPSGAAPHAPGCRRLALPGGPRLVSLTRTRLLCRPLPRALPRGDRLGPVSGPPPLFRWRWRRCVSALGGARRVRSPAAMRGSPVRCRARVLAPGCASGPRPVRRVESPPAAPRRPREARGWRVGRGGEGLCPRVIPTPRAPVVLVRASAAVLVRRAAPCRRGGGGGRRASRAPCPPPPVPARARARARGGRGSARGVGLGPPRA